MVANDHIEIAVGRGMHVADEVAVESRDAVSQFPCPKYVDIYRHDIVCDL